MLIDVSNGEIIDKITILEIKSERIQDFNKLKNVDKELNILRSYEFETKHKKDLKRVNEKLWECEDIIRDLDKNNIFDKSFIKCAREIYIFNDERCRIKRLINDETNSEIIEEKEY